MSVIVDGINLEDEYSPTRFSPRFPTPKQVFENHLKHVTEASKEAVNNVPHKLEIEYGPAPGQKLDLFGTDLPDDAAILVYFHGGYWYEMSREMSRFPAEPLYKAKIKTIILGYDLCPNVTMIDIVNEIESGAKYVFEYAEKMGSKGVYFAGHCAGAHLVAKLLASANLFKSCQSSRHLQGAFLVAGIYDLREIVHTSYNEFIRLENKWIVPLSPLFDDYTHLREQRVRIFVIAGQHDTPTFKRQSRELYELLHNTCLMQNMYLHIRDGADHFINVECFSSHGDDNYLRSLLLHDIRKYLS